MSRTIVVVLTLLAAACGGTTGSPVSDGCADVIEADVVRSPDGTLRFDVTVESADTGWDKYADAWEVRAGEGEVIATRVLAHPHVNEQPFTRSLSNVEVPPGITEVTIAARDSVAGFCGKTLAVELP